VLFACGPTTRPEPLPRSSRPANPTCVAPPRPAARAHVVRAFPRARFDQPVSLAASSDHAWWFVAERTGRIWRLAAGDDAAVPQLVLDISAHVESSTGSIGLLSIAIDPRPGSTILYASYTGRGGTLASSRLTRFISHDAGRTWQRDRDLIELDQQADYHVNTDLRFGPDGYLYVGFGDGGPQGDPYERAQDPRTLKGKILRLDVSVPGPYRIPADNPFAHGGGAPEVWALGLRNPWRFGFDRETGELYAGDVGSDYFEEIDRITRGGNYGWPAREATRCMTPACKHIDATDPIVSLAQPEYSSVTFGVVYRGNAVPALRGQLLFADYASGVIYEVDTKGGKPRVLDNAGRTIVSFAEDSAGEPMLVDLMGMLWRLEPGHDGPTDAPALLSDTGCFSHDGVPTSGLVPYDINQSFWSDGGVKRRWLALPDGQQMKLGDSGQLDLPAGSVVIKEFSIGGLRVETRLLARHDDGEWAGYTYRWDLDQRDARLVPAQAKGITAAWPRPWYLPHRGECSRCHQAAAGHTLGLEVAQLARTVDGEDQLATFARIGLLADAPAMPPALPSRDAGSVEERARAWLHVNCSFCHRPGGTGQGNLDLRYTTPLAQMNVCKSAPRYGTFGLGAELVVAPGDPTHSMLVQRIRTLGFIRMPPLGALTTDREGIALVEQWIRELRCP
jgi:uncharacterized repeat protein (TIGR03806 family)